jgi:hypothetical protein
MKTTGSKAAAAARIGAALGRRKRAELLGLLRPCFGRTEPWLQAGKYAAAVMCDLRRPNGWTIAERSGDRTPDWTQRLLNRAVWDTFAAMGVVRRFAVAGLDEAARRTGRRRSLAVAAVDETGQVKAGTRTAGVKRQFLGCAGKVANGINTVHLTYAREGTGHALIGAREWIPAAHIGDAVTSAAMGLPVGLAFRTKGQLAIDILAEAFADGVRLDFVCGDEVYGACTELREYLEDHDQGYVLRVPSSFRLILAGGVTLTCKQAAARLGSRRGWEVRSAGTRIQRTTLVRLGMAGHRLPAAPPADPPPPDHRRTGLSLLLPARRPAGVAVAAGPRRRAQMAGRRRFRVRQGLLRARPVPSPPLHRDRPAHRAGHGRPGRLRRHRRPAAPPHRHRRTRPGTPRPATAHRPRDDPAHRPRNRAPTRSPAPARQRRALAGLAAPPPSPATLVPPANTAGPPRRDRPGQVANGCCRTRLQVENGRSQSIGGTWRSY